MTDKELKELRDQSREMVGSNAVVLAALINAKAQKDASLNIKQGMDNICNAIKILASK